MYTDEELDQLEQEEHGLTEEAFAALLLLLGLTKEELESELTTFYRKYGTDGVITYQAARKWVSEKDHTKRMFALFSYIGTTFDGSFVDFEHNFRNHLMTIVESEIEFFDIDPSLINIDKILDMTWGVDDLTWSERLWAYYDKWTTVISNDLKQSFLRRDSLLDVIKDLEKRFLSMEKILWRLYVTETTAVGSLARKEIFKELGIKKYRFYAREDERTCEHCGSLHGLIFPISAYEVGVTASPIHGHCRCWEVPIMD
jgi:SPP1 gp7 family putative phage head morphogenesis protein